MNTIIWSTGTNFSFPVKLCLQTNGFLTIQDFNNNYLWISKLISSSQFGGYLVNIQDDSNIVVYDSQNIAYWSILDSRLTGYQLLTNYWPMSNMSDIVGGANLYGGLNYSFVPDRFCSANSAIYFNQGYLQVPPGYYFTGDFTVTAWIYLKSYQYYSRIIDFGNGQSSSNVISGMFGNSSNLFGIIFQNLNFTNLKTSLNLNLSQWYFVSYVLSSNTAYIYVNGIQVGTGQSFAPSKILRTKNYIGKSNWDANSYADAIYDEIKIYQGGLSLNQIINEYNFSSNNGIKF
jgi:hypothetical protein